MIDELVKSLSKGKHEVIIAYGDKTCNEIKQTIENGYIHVEFTQTKGRTILVINIDSDRTNLGDIDFNKGEGTMHIEGTTNLNYDKVRCISDIDLNTRKGTGYLQIIAEEIIDAE